MDVAETPLDRRAAVDRRSRRGNRGTIAEDVLESPLGRRRRDGMKVTAKLR